MHTTMPDSDQTTCMTTSSHNGRNVVFVAMLPERFHTTSNDSKRAKSSL